MLLAGDIGGTKTIIGIFSHESGHRTPVAETTFPSNHYPCLELPVNEFLSRVDISVDGAVFAVAGPVIAGHAKVTNLPWVVEETFLQRALNLPSVRLLNDLEAIAYALPFLIPKDLHTLNKGNPSPGGVLAVIAAGTGLGEAFLTCSESVYRAYATEGGHTDFAPTNSLELELLNHLQNRFQHISYERVCSGIGLPNIYRFFKDSGREREPAWLAEQLAQASDPTPIIVDTALDRKNACDICVKSLHMFINILGAEAGNLALNVLATGGVYLGGGIPPRIRHVLKNGRFMEAFRRKGRMSDLLMDIPVHLILHSGAAILGAACFGLGLNAPAKGSIEKKRNTGRNQGKKRT